MISFPSAEDTRKKLENLPPDIQSRMYSDETAAIIQSVGAKNRLRIDQLESLERAVHLAMMGLIKPEGFAQHLVDSLRVEQGTAATLTQGLNERLFLKIRESMQKALTSRAASLPARQTPEALFSTETGRQEELPDVRASLSLAKPNPLDTLAVSKEKVVDVGLFAQKPPEYRIDPYREPVE